MSSSNYTNKLLVCFAIDQFSYSLNAVVIDPENSLEILKYSNNVKETAGSPAIVSALNPNEKESIVCIIDSTKTFLCLIYEFESNEFTDFETMNDNCQLYPLNMGVYYIKERNEYYAFCNIQNNVKYFFIRLDPNYNNKCNTIIDFSIPGVYNFYSTRLLYLKNQHFHYMLYSAKTNDDIFSSLKIEICNYTTDDIIINEDIEDNSKLSSSIPITIPTTLISSTSIKKVVRTSEILTSKTSIISSSTVLEQTNSKTIINSSQFQSVIKSELSSSTILSKFSQFPSTKLTSHLTQTYIALESSLIFTSSHNTIFHNIVYSLHMDGDIIKGKIDKTKEELENNIDQIMDEIEIGKKYEITGNDYNLTITPINIIQIKIKT